MKLLRQHATLVRLTAVLSIYAFLLQGCTKWKAQPLEPERFAASKSPGSVRITLANGARATASHPWNENDSLLWKLEGSRAKDPVQRTGVPLADVAKVEVRGFDAVRTTVWVVVGLVAAVAIVAASDPSYGPIFGGGGGGGYGGESVPAVNHRAGLAAVAAPASAAKRGAERRVRRRDDGDHCPEPHHHIDRCTHGVEPAHLDLSDVRERHAGPLDRV